MIFHHDRSRLLVAALLALLANGVLLGLSSVLVRDTPHEFFPAVRVPVTLIHLEERVEAPPRPLPEKDPPPEEPIKAVIPDLDLSLPAPTRPAPPALSIELGDLQINFRDEDFIFLSSELDHPPRVVSRIPPTYPFGARQRGTEGFVQVRFLVAPDGSISRISIIDAEPPGVFESSVLRILPRWRIAPGLIDGEAVYSWMATTIHFELTS